MTVMEPDVTRTDCGHPGSAVLGSITDFTRAILLHGSLERLLCSWIVLTDGAM